MAISTVPEIKGTSSFGGVIYGLNLQMGYSSSPSKLIVDIISKDGNYSTPSLNQAITITFGDFKFKGIVWAYNIKETVGEKTLQIEIIDNSILLDRHYVMLWKRGFFGNKGEKQTVVKEVNINENILVPILVGNSIEFKLEKFEKQNIDRDVYFAAGRSGNIFYLGTEDIPDTKCDIPDTYYTLDDLKDLVGDTVKISFEAPQDYRATHEGTLREVLQAWAEDCGVDFYWDYNLDKIVFYPIDKGISGLPSNVNADNLIEQSISQSMEGTFSQQCFAYTAKPKGELVVKEYNYETSATININPFPISWFLKNNDTLQSLDLPKEEEGESENPDAGETNLWGGRTEDEFLEAAFLGYIDENLRDLWSIYNGNLYVCGISKPKGAEGEATTGGGEEETPSTLSPIPKKFTDAEKKAVAEQLRKSAPGDMEELEKISPDFTEHEIYDVNIDDNLNTKWKQIEQEILASYGSVYRHNIRAGRSFYCSPTFNTEIESTVDPEPVQDEPDNDDFKGFQIFRRQGTFSHDQNQALAILGLQDSDVIAGINQLRIYKYDNQSYQLKNVVPNIQGSNLLIIPKKSLFTKVIGNFDISVNESINKQEVTVETIQNAQSSNNISNCTLFDENLEKSKCKSLQDEALEAEYERLNIAKTESNTDTPLVSGLSNNRAKIARISLGKKKIVLAAPSYSPFTVVTNFSINAKKAYDFNSDKIFFKGTGSKADDVAKIDVLIDNITNSDDSFMVQRVSDLPLAKNLVHRKPQEKSVFKFAGEPVGVNLNPAKGLSSMDISYSADGFTTTVEYNSRPPLRTTVNKFLDKVQSQLNRKSFNSN